MLLAVTLVLAFISITHGITYRSSFVAAFEYLYNSTDGSHWKWRPVVPLQYETWNFSDPSNICFWQGVCCTDENGKVQVSMSCENMVLDYSSAQVVVVTGIAVIEQALHDVSSPPFTIIGVSLKDFGLNGTLPSEFFQLTTLQFLTLAGNRLQGTIPPQISKMEDLTWLTLSGNRHTGKIPTSLTLLTKLVSLDLQTNFLTGGIPFELGQLTALKYLVLNFNRISKHLPKALGNLTSMVFLSAVYNHLSGPLPVELGLLSNLTYLYFCDNSLTGQIPLELTRYSVLQYYGLDNNLFTGAIPTSFDFPAIKGLWLNTNMLTGSLPSSLNALTNVEQIYLYTNLLTGIIPTSIAELQNVNALFLQDNLLTGSLTEQLMSMKQLQDGLYIGSNFLTGTIPTIIGQMKQLGTLSIAINMISGTLPSELQSLESLSMILMQYNLLTGSLHDKFSANQRNLSTLELSNNAFTGNIPESIFQLPKLKNLVIVESCMIGSLPDNICEATSLRVLALNGLTTASPCRLPLLFNYYMPKIYMSGTVPGCLFQLPMLNILQLSGNGFYGQLPFELNFTLSSSLRNLSLSHNRLSGTIPLSFQQRMTGFFQLLDLSFNRLSGEIQQMGGFYDPLPLSYSKTVFNRTTVSSNLSWINYESFNNVELVLQVNELSGNLPGSFWNPTNVMTIVNGNLFGCLISATLPPQDPGSSTTGCGSAYLDVALLFGACVVMMSLMLIVVIFVLPRWLLKKGTNISVKNKNISSLSPSEDIRGTIEMSMSNSSLSLSMSSIRSHSVAVRSGSSSLANYPITTTTKTTTHNILTPLALAHMTSVISVGAEAQLESVTAPVTLPLSSLAEIIDNDDNDKDNEHTLDIAELTDTLRRYLMKCVRLSDAVPCWAKPWEPTRSSHVLYNMPKTVGFIQFVKTMDYLALRTCLYILLPCLALQLLFKYVHRTSFSTHSHQYWFTPSLAYIKGYLPAAFTLVLVIGFGSALHRTIKMNYDNYARFRPPSSPLRLLKTTKLWRKVVVMASITTADLLIMCTANFLYLYYSLGLGYTVVPIAALEIILGLIKLVWNMFLLPMSLHELRAYVLPTDRESRMPTMLLSALMIINNTLIPILVTMATDSNCLNFVFTPLPPITFEFVFADLCVGLFADQCLVRVPQVETVSYHPPFIYSYQCSSSMLRYYTPVFVAMYSFLIMLSPVLVWLIPYMFSRVKSTGILRNIIRFLQAPITQSKSQLLDDLDSTRIILAADEISATSISNLAVLLTFGVAYPILGVLITAVMWVDAKQQRYLIGRYLIKCSHVQLADCAVMKQKLELACTGLSFVLDKFKWFIIITMTLFYSLFIFDMTGNNENVYWNSAMALPLLMMIWPIALAVFNLIHIHGTNLFVPLANATRVSSLKRNISLTRLSQRFGVTGNVNNAQANESPTTTPLDSQTDPATKVYYVSYNSNFADN